VILVDANLLIYAVDRDSPHHDAAAAWLERTLSGTERVALAWVVILAFLRVTTRGDLFARPLSPEAAMAYVDSWVHQPFVTLVSPGEGHWPIFRSLLAATGTAGNLTSDAHLAALALELGCPIYSTDYDFNRFPAVKLVNPLETDI
jgi:toxin-antitoxin system PIN domain toxin